MSDIKFIIPNDKRKAIEIVAKDSKYSDALNIIKCKHMDKNKWAIHYSKLDVLESLITKLGGNPSLQSKNQDETKPSKKTSEKESPKNIEKFFQKNEEEQLKQAAPTHSEDLYYEDEEPSKADKSSRVEKEPKKL